MSIQRIVVLVVSLIAAWNDAGVRAATEGSVELQSVAHGHYPGKRLPAGVLNLVTGGAPVVEQRRRVGLHAVDGEWFERQHGLTGDVEISSAAEQHPAVVIPEIIEAFIVMERADRPRTLHR